MELGCFVAGLMVSVTPEHTGRIINLVEPIRDLFGCIFFVTMGLHIYPSFLLSQVARSIVPTLLWTRGHRSPPTPPRSGSHPPLGRYLPLKGRSLPFGTLTIGE